MQNANTHAHTRTHGGGEDWKMGREGASEARALGRRRRAIFRSASQISWARAKILYRRVVNLGMLNEEAGKGGGGGGNREASRRQQPGEERYCVLALGRNYGKSSKLDNREERRPL